MQRQVTGMMTAEVVQLAPAGRARQWPVLVPREMLTRYQPVIGVEATMVWLNLYELADGGADAEFVSVEAQLATRMRLAPEAIARAVETLGEAGLLERGSGRWIVLWPGAAPPTSTANVAASAAVQFGDGVVADSVTGDAGASPAAAVEVADEQAPAQAAIDPALSAPLVESPAQGPVATESAATASGVHDRGVADEAVAEQAPQDRAAAAEDATDVADDDAAGWNSDEAALQAVVQFYHQRIGMLGPSQFEKLRFWVEDQGMSSDVVALAIEETVQSAERPTIHYTEGVLRNWYNANIRTLADLQNSKRVRSQEVPPTTEGTPNAASFNAVDKDAVRRWKEMYADEYDD